MNPARPHFGNCAWLASHRARVAVTRAFRQAMDEHGIAAHPDGACPAPSCRCRELESQVIARAVQIAAAELGVTPESLDPATPL